MSSFRESSIVILDTSRTLVRAGVGLHELLKTPSVELPARVGLRRGVNGASHDEPMDAEPSTSAVPDLTSTAKVTDYLVGAQLDEALAAGQEVDVFWPFADGDLKDWTQAEAVWKHVLFNQLGLRRGLMESPVLLSFAPGLSRDTYEGICRMFFERFNVAGLSIIERPMAQFFAVTVSGTEPNGVVIDIGHEHTDVTPIYESFVVQDAHQTVGYGISDCEQYLAHLLLSNPSVVNTLSPPDAQLAPDELRATLVEVARQVWREGLVKVLAEGEAADIEEEGVTDIAAVVVAGKEKAVIESGMKKKQNAKASAAELARAKEIEALDLVTVQFRDKQLTLGKERHRFCEPLFDPSLLKAIPGLPRNSSEESIRSLQTAVGHAVSLTEVDARQYIYQGLFVTGELTSHIKGLGAALQARLAPFVLSQIDQQNEVQPKSIRTLRIPDYFAEYRDKGDGLASFLGSSIVAKIIFVNEPNGRNFVTKADYAEKGPKAILGQSASLL
ncbi:actin [Phanerochaete sordida]|uniref:Actin n=1 Tax=Phanerochaete sordida TaxID=48140 RepID=A0A9P3G8C0_9APHY|nr:actin [Phanerochaete sordida]